MGKSKRQRQPVNWVARRLIAQDVIPRAVQYGGYRGNYGAHAMCFSFADCTFWFSYDSLVAFRIKNNEVVVLKNYWGPTTGKHLSHIPSPSYDKRVSEAEFLVLLNNQLKEAGLGVKGTPFLRVDQDPKTLEYTGYIGLRQKGEPDIPPPKPKKSDFYLHPKKPTRADKRWMRQTAEREKHLRELENIDGLFSWDSTDELALI
jgi:hypothetical protein